MELVTVFFQANRSICIWPVYQKDLRSSHFNINMVFFNIKIIFI